MSYWYLAHNNELLIDLDDAMRDSGRGPHIELYFRRRLREAILAGKIDVREVYLTRSASDHHFQAVIRLNQRSNKKGVYVNAIKRLVWQLYLGSDLYRARADLMRSAQGYSNASLLILPERIPDFYREPDAECSCTHKHKLDSTCPVFGRYRGPEMVELFGPLRKEAEKMVPLPLGRVPLDLILEVRK
jgi:hypothetical protein